ncbi:MAG: dihydroorotate dehydrogenase [Phycisphaerales bacterium]|nr:dihydroorotate dehydrogenase [Phycisphaerales bacterium]
MGQNTTTTPIDLSVDLAGVHLINPVMTASGTSGFGPEYAAFLDISSLGAFVTKAVTPEERRGNPQPRTVETAAGMLNAIGLANVGLERFCREKVGYLSGLGIPIVVNVAGRNADDYANVCRRLDEIECLSILELNVSCPNVSDGLDYGTDAGRLEALVAHVRPFVRRAKLMVKLSPNVTDITATARAAVNGGAEILSLINTLQGMAINVETRKPMLANRVGGLSGPAIKPVAVCMTDKVYRAVARDAGVPIVAMGGIQNWRDAVEFMLAGATAVAVGTMLFVDPTVPIQIREGLTDYCHRHGLSAVRNIVGQVDR